MLISFIIGVVIIVVIAVVWTAAADQSAAEEKGNVLKSIPGFSVSASFLGGRNASGIAIDMTSRRVAILKGSTAPILFGFDEITGVEVARDGMSLTKTNRGSQVAGAAVGAALLGPVGLLLGGLSGSRRQVEKVTRLSLKIYTSNVSYPANEVVFFVSDTPISADGEGVRGLIHQLDSWYGRIHAAMVG